MQSVIKNIIPNSKNTVFEFSVSWRNDKKTCLEDGSCHDKRYACKKYESRFN